MRLFVIRHATAEEPGSVPDAERRLTEQGRAEARRAGRALRQLEARVGTVLSSPAGRAVETARLIAASFEPPEPVDVLEALWGGGGAEGILAALLPFAGRDRLAIVGHQPHLGALVARLAAASVPFRPSAVCCVEVGGDDLHSARLIWYRGPDDLAALAGAP